MHSETISGVGLGLRRSRHPASAGPLDRLRRLVDRLASRHERRVRDTLAEALERAIDDIDRPLRRGATVPVDRRAVAEAAPLLHQVAIRLRDPGPLPAGTLRLCRSLVGDGGGPLYSASAHRSEYPPGTLGRFARAILAHREDRDGTPVSDRSAPVRGQAWRVG